MPESNFNPSAPPLPAEERLMLICARRTHSDDLKTEARTLGQNVNWERLTDLSLKHRVGPIVYASLRTCLGDITPPSSLSRLRQDTLAAVQHNLGLLREAIRIARLFREQGVRYALFKGLTINQMVYGDLSIRKCGDIDILVDPADFLRVKQLLVSEGFSQTLTDQGELQCLQSGLWHEQRNISVDLHWGLPPRELRIRSKLILDHAAPIMLGGQALSAFCRDDLLIALCVNATKEYWNQLLYPYCDIHEFLRSHPDLDPETLLSRARRLRCERMVLTALQTVSSLYQSSVPARFARLAPADSRAKKELIRQIFSPPQHGGAASSHSQLLTQFESTDAYFMALMDTSLQRLIYRAIHVPLRHYVPEAPEPDIIQLPKSLAFLRPIIGALQIGGLLMRRIHRKLTGHR